MLKSRPVTVAIQPLLDIGRDIGLQLVQVEASLASKIDVGPSRHTSVLERIYSLSCDIQYGIIAPIHD